jgi:hypothetical protein
VNAPAVDVATILVSASCGVLSAVTGWGIWIGREPETPDQAVTVYDYGGDPPSPKHLIDRPAVQVRVRGVPYGYAAAYAHALKCREALQGYAGHDVGSTRYVLITAASDPVFLQYDARSRPIWVVNYNVIRSPSSGTYRS